MKVTVRQEYVITLTTDQATRLADELADLEAEGALDEDETPALISLLNAL